MGGSSLPAVLALGAGVVLVWWAGKGGAANLLRALNNNAAQVSAPPATAPPANAPGAVTTVPGDSLKGGNFVGGDSWPTPPTVGGLVFDTPQQQVSPFAH